MFLKSLAFMTPLAVAIYYFTSVGGYSREVDRAPAQVMSALEDLDITEQPGSPGTDPSRSGGIKPLFRLERGPDSLTWLVMSGDKVATRMIAHIAPLDGGRRTKVTAEVQRGDASDDFVSPAFRSKGLTMGLFGMALEDELNQLTLPAGNPAKCQELMDRFAASNEADADLQRQTDLSDAMGDTARTAMRLNATEAELRRNGCDTSQGEFKSVTSHMAPGPGDPTRHRSADGEVSFEPGKPMVDLSKRR